MKFKLPKALNVPKEHRLYALSIVLLYLLNLSYVIFRYYYVTTEFTLTMVFSMLGVIVPYLGVFMGFYHFIGVISALISLGCAMSVSESIIT